MGGFDSLTLFSQPRHLRRVMPSLDPLWLLLRMPCSSALPFTKFHLVTFSFSRCWFQEFSLINGCSLFSFAESVFLGAQYAQVLGEEFEKLTCIIVFCEVNTIIVSILQRRKLKHKEVNYLSWLVNFLLTTRNTCQRLYEFWVAETRFKPQPLWTPEFKILVTALTTQDVSLRKTHLQVYMK